MKIPVLRVPFSDEDLEFMGSGVKGILSSGTLTMGPHTEEFEALFAAFVGAKYAVACSSGTAALELILRALEIEGRGVIVPTNTFLATALAVVHSGNRVVFADSDPETFCLDVDDVERRITDQTAAVLLVHVGGIITPALERLRQLCRRQGLYLIEDCAHAHGCAIDGQGAGTLGVAGAFSFFPTKVLTTGEGGVVTTNDEGLDRQLRVLRNHGKNPAVGGRISEVGNNHRMSEITALLGVRQVQRAQELIGERRRVAEFYDARLGGIPGLRRPAIPTNVLRSYYKYPVYLPDGVARSELKATLKARHDVALPGEVYADLCHTEPVWDSHMYCGRRRSTAEARCTLWPSCGCADRQAGFPGAEYISQRHICLPIYPGLKANELEHIVRVLGLELARLSEVTSFAS